MTRPAHEVDADLRRLHEFYIAVMKAIMNGALIGFSFQRTMNSKQMPLTYKLKLHLTYPEAMRKEPPTF